ncbi:MAG: SHD1 domain-containing protein, partial [bacterium]
MNHEKIFGGLCIIALSLQLAQAETRAWKNIDGVEIKAEFVKVEGEDVTLKLPNGKQVTFAQSKLSEEDRAFIKTIPA